MAINFGGEEAEDCLMTLKQVQIKNGDTLDVGMTQMKFHTIHNVYTDVDQNSLSLCK